MAARSLSDFVYGNFSAARSVFTASAIFTGALASALFPSFSRLTVAGEDIVSRTYGVAVKYASLVLLPVAIIFLGIPDALIAFFYGSNYALAAGFLRLLSISLFFCVIGVGVTLPALLSLRRTKTIALIQVIAIVLSYFFIMLFLEVSLVYAFIIGIIVMNLVGAVLGFLVLWRDYRAWIDFIFSLKALFSAFIALGVIYLVKSYIYHPFFVIVVCGLVSIVVYVALIAVLGSLSEVDYGNLRRYARAIPVFNWVFLIIIDWMEWIYRRVWGRGVS